MHEILLCVQWTVCLFSHAVSTPSALWFKHQSEWNTNHFPVWLRHACQILLGFLMRKLHLSITNRPTVLICDSVIIHSSHTYTIMLRVWLRPFLSKENHLRWIKIKFWHSVFLCNSNMQRGLLMEWDAKLAQHWQHCTQLRKQIIHVKRLSQCISIGSAFWWKAKSVSHIQVFEKRTNWCVFIHRHKKGIQSLWGFWV